MVGDRGRCKGNFLGLLLVNIIHAVNRRLHTEAAVGVVSLVQGR